LGDQMVSLRAQTSGELSWGVILYIVRLIVAVEVDFMNKFLHLAPIPHLAMLQVIGRSQQ
jgi:hypothetical protein